MALFTLSDTHLSFGSDKPMDIFGARWRGHHEKIMSCWNRVVSDNDTVVVGGDISWAMTTERAEEDLIFIDRLRGNKIFIKGNHDYWWTTLKKVTDFFDSHGITTIKLLQNNSFSCCGKHICGTRGWYSDAATAPEDSDYMKIVAREAQRLELSLKAAPDTGEEKIVFLHFPAYFEGYVCRPLTELMKSHGVRRCFYGHVHGVYNIAPRTVFEGIEFSIVSADYLNFTPLRIAD